MILLLHAILILSSMNSNSQFTHKFNYFLKTSIVLKPTSYQLSIYPFLHKTNGILRLQMLLES